MPRTYKPSLKRNHKKYDPSVLEKALKEYNSCSKSFSEISQKYDIIKSVLSRHNNYTMKTLGGQTALSPAEEEYLVKHINVCSEWGYPLESFDLRVMIKGYLDDMGKEVKRFRNNMPGPDFISHFSSRNKNKISERLNQNKKRARAAVSPEIIEQYFRELEKSLEGVPPSNIINYNETNLRDDPACKQVLVRRAVKYPERTKSQTQEGSISLMLAAAADGSLLPPYVVYKAQNICNTWWKNGPKGGRYNCTPSGWFDAITFQDWVRSIAFPYFEDKSGSKILIGDCLSSHLSIDLIKECHERGIKFIFPPAKAIHRIQPLEVAFFRSLECAWRVLLLQWKKIDGRAQATIGKRIFPSLLKKILKKLECNDSNKISAGFETCGIYPMNKQKFLELFPAYTPEFWGSKEVLDETELSKFKEMMHGTLQIQRCNKKKKIKVVPGCSVLNMEDEECDENYLQDATNDNGEVKNTDNDHEVSGFVINSKAGPSKQNIKRKRKTIDTKQEKNQIAAAQNKEKTDRGVKTTNKSLIKIKERINNDQEMENQRNYYTLKYLNTGKIVKNIDIDTINSLINKVKTEEPIKGDTKNEKRENYFILIVSE